jgi:hypothetical protein
MTKADELLERGHRTLDWAGSLLTKDGAFAGAGDVINAYYKSVVVFTTGGRVHQARAIAGHVARTFHRDGDFNGRPGDPTAVTLSNYRNAWLGRGMQALGRFDIANAVARHLVGQVHPGHGGIPAMPFQPEGAREYDWGTTGSAILGLMALGRWDAAIAAGGFLRQMVLDQPVTRGKLFLRRDANGDLMRAETRIGLATTYAIDIGATGQIYWYLGIAMNAFAGLYQGTGDPKWREAGYAVFDLFECCHPEVYEIISNGKVAWGLAAMAGATGDQRFAKAALDVWDWHCRVQYPDGRWLRVGQIASLDEQPLHVTLDTSLERAFYMFELARTLDI